MMTEDTIADIKEHFKDKPFLSLEEVAELLGVKPKAVYNWTRRSQKERRLPKITLGHHTRLPRAGFIEWLRQEHQIKTGAANGRV